MTSSGTARAPIFPRTPESFDTGGAWIRQQSCGRSAFETRQLVVPATPADPSMFHDGGDPRSCEIWTVDKEKIQIRMRSRAVPEERRWQLSQPPATRSASYTATRFCAGFYCRRDLESECGGAIRCEALGAGASAVSLASQVSKEGDYRRVDLAGPLLLGPVTAAG